MARTWNGLPAAVLAMMLGCSPGEPGMPPAYETAAQEPIVRDAEAGALLEAELARIDAALARIDSIFQPLPLLRGEQEEALRRFGNAAQLERARALGVPRLSPPERIEELQRQGSLVRLQDSEHWVIRDLDHSQPLVVPSVQALLTRIGERFHARLAALGAPPYRLEISSVLRTAQEQERLRQVNPNAALGESTHEYGTTVDILYSAYSAPAGQFLAITSTPGVEWGAPILEHYARIAAERVAGRRSHELKAILGEVLIELQNEGLVMVTLERLQPVYHLTVARRF